MTELEEKYKAFIEAKGSGQAQAQEAEAELLAVFTREVLSVCSDFLTETSHNHVIYTLIREISDNAAFEEELADTLAKILYYTEKGKQRFMEDTAYSEIIFGIYDTISIKVQSLAESREVLDNIEADIIKRASGDMKIPELSAEEADEMLKLFAKHIEETKIGDIPQSLDAALLFDTFASFKEKREKRYNALINLVKKQSNMYVRDYLLYEVSSFEEIVNLSVSRLLNSEHPVTQAFAAFCRDVFNEITAVLSRYGITPIRPDAGAPFNAKEHEILSAEENPQYKKGLIIKTIASGYMRGGGVISRAYVIAAK